MGKGFLGDFLRYNVDQLVVHHQRWTQSGILENLDGVASDHVTGDSLNAVVDNKRPVLAKNYEAVLRPGVEDVKDKPCFSR